MEPGLETEAKRASEADRGQASGRAARPERETTVLFASLLGGTVQQAISGDAPAHEIVENCLARLREAAESCGARVVKTLPDRVMVLAATPDAAADAAAAMHAAVAAFPAAAQEKIALGIGLHHGPVIQQGNDVFGGSVNLAARLLEQAARGQIITSEETAQRLGPIYRAWVRRLYSIQVRGVADEVVLCELVWRADDDATAPGRRRAAAAPARAGLRLRYRDREILRRREKDAIAIGRDESCGLVVADHMASRQHCTVERRVDKFVLTDHSANGTYVTVEGEDEVVLHRESLTLRRRGWIACGQPRAGTPEVIEYLCD